MLLQFSVDNFRSIKDSLTFSMLTASQDSCNSFQVGKYELLSSAVIYGANASGKSNVLKAMAFMRRMVLNQDKIIQSTDELPHDPYKLNTETQFASSTFEIVFFINDVKYRYGFEADNASIYCEWLYEDKSGRKEAKLFYRDEEKDHYVNPNRFKEGFAFFDTTVSKLKISKNQLFLWQCDRNDGEISKGILYWFKQLNLIDGLNNQEYINYTIKQMEDKTFKNEICNLVKSADIGIEDILVDSPDNSSFLNERQRLDIGVIHSIELNTIHKKYNEHNTKIGSEFFDLFEEESVGTQKFFSISAPIIDTLREGKVLLIDELDASLHPVLTKHLIRLFHDETINTKKAQLIFATHDTNLLKPYIFRRDQIWLSEKDQYGATHIYALAQIKGVLKNEDFEKQYIQGKYGAIPYLGKFEFQV